MHIPIRPHSQCMTLRISAPMLDVLTEEAKDSNKSLSRVINDNVVDALALLFGLCGELKNE